jgi:2-oxoisovalerate dehydrogenase E1 component
MAFNEESLSANLATELKDVYKEYQQEIITPSNKKSNIRLIDAISDGLRDSMKRYDNLIIMGQDVAEYGGVFKITEGFTEQFGRERVRNTPICESAIVSAAYGAAINGMKAVMEMQFADFVSSGFNPIVKIGRAHV